MNNETQLAEANHQWATHRYGESVLSAKRAFELGFLRAVEMHTKQENEQVVKPKQPESLQYAMLENELLGWWTSQKLNFSEFRALVQKLENFARRQTLEEVLTISNSATRNYCNHDYFELKRAIRELL